MGEWLEVGGPLLQLVYNPFDGKVYVTQDYAAGQMIQALGSATTTVISNSYPYAVNVNRANGYIYTSLRQNGGVTVTNGLSTVATVRVGNSPYGMAISYNTKRLYVANASDDTVSVIDINPLSGSFHRVIKTIPVSRTPMSIGVDDSVGYGYVYVANRESYNLSVISESQLRVVGAVALGFKPGEIAVSTGTHKVYVVQEYGNSITVVNEKTFPGVVQTSFSVGSDPWGIAVDPNQDRLFISDYTDMTVTLVKHTDPEDGTTYTTERVDPYPSPMRGVYVDPDTGEYYAAGTNGYYSHNGVPCDRWTLDTCVEMRSQGLVGDADVEQFLDCYFHQL